MKAGVYSASVLLLAGFLAGCGGDKEEKAAAIDHSAHQAHQGHEAHQMPAAGQVTQAQPEASPVTGAQGLVLNGMEKWQTDDHTREMIAKMRARLGQKPLADYSTDELKQIGADLRKDIDDLIVGCTMEGAAHNELHKFLAEFAAEVDALASSGDMASAEKVLGALEEYARYFQ